MALDLRKLARAFRATDTIVSIPYTSWLLQHGDAPLDERTAEIIKRLLMAVPRNRAVSFSASSAHVCERAQVFGYLGIDTGGGGIDAQLQNIFNDGKWRHLRWQAALMMAGILKDIEDPQTWPRKRVVGTMDGTGVVPSNHPRSHWRGKEFGFELKGVSAFQYPNLTEPMEKHLQQTDTYFLMSGFELFVLLYENKTTQEWKEWVIEPDSKRMKIRQKQIDRLNDSIDTKTLPPMLHDCTIQRGPLFNKDCPFGGRGGICVRAGKGWPQIAKH